MEKWMNPIVWLMIVLFLMDQFIPAPFAAQLLFWSSLTVMLASAYRSTRLPKWFSMIMITGGTVILTYQGAGPEIWENAVLKNLPIICLIIAAPLLAIIIRQGGYDDAIISLVGKMKGSMKLLFSSLLLLFNLVGPATNLGSITLIHTMMEKLKLPAEFLARVYTRGFSSINTWSPYFASVVLVIYYLDLPFVSFLPFGLLLCFFQVLLSGLLFSVREGSLIKYRLPGLSSEMQTGKLFELAMIMISLIALIFVLEPLLNVNSSVLIVIVLILFPVCWSLMKRMFIPFVLQAEKVGLTVIQRQSNEISLFFSAGFFSVALAGTPLSGMLNHLWDWLAEQSILLLIVFTILLVALSAFAGVHQIVTISSILVSVSPAGVGLDPVTFAMTLLSAWAIGSIVSPVAPMNVITSNLLKVSVYRIIIKWNLSYAILLAGTHSVLIYVVHLLVG